MISRPIGIFDSGVGGLTVLRQLAARMPEERMIYLGDTARLPYGTKSRETVVRYSLHNAAFLQEQEVKLLVVACNTASSLALGELQKKLRIPVVGVILSGAEKAAASSRSRKVGVIGTVATVRSGAYEAAIRECAPDVQVVSVACPLFVALAEEGWLQDEVTQRIAQRYLKPLQDQGVDVLVLGCTHYPLLKPVLSEVMGKGVLLVDSAEEVAAQVERTLQALGLRNAPPAVTRSLPPRIYLTDCSPHFLELCERILAFPPEEVEYVDLG